LNRSKKGKSLGSHVIDRMPMELRWSGDGGIVISSRLRRFDRSVSMPATTGCGAREIQRFIP
jgi:hypothetical protein